MSKIDLHMHTNASDGQFSPEKLLDEAINKHMDVIAITDHDTINALPVAFQYIKDNCLKIELIPGIELSCTENALWYDEVHIIGLFIDFNDPDLIEVTECIRKCRIEEKKEIIKKLNSLGFDITFSEVQKLVGSTFGRPHIARILLDKYPDQFTCIDDVFTKYIGAGKPAFVKLRGKLHINKAVDVIKKAGGIPVLAHPGVFNDHDAQNLITLFLKYGGIAIETNYPYHKCVSGITKGESDRKNILFRKIAMEKNILESGGSDFHGKNIRDIKIGDYTINYEKFMKLKLFKCVKYG